MAEGQPETVVVDLEWQGGSRFLGRAGGVPLVLDSSDRMERALALSREKYCSVWHSLRPDLDLAASFEIVRTS